MSGCIIRAGAGAAVLWGLYNLLPLLASENIRLVVVAAAVLLVDGAGDADLWAAVGKLRRELRSGAP